MSRSVQKKQTTSTNAVEKRVDSTEIFKRELNEIRTRLEGFIERIDFIESQIGVSSKSNKQIKKRDSKSKEKFSSQYFNQLHNIILIEGECDIGNEIEMDDNSDNDDELNLSSDEYCTVLLIMSNDTSYGDIVYIKKNSLRQLCECVLKSSIGDKIPFPDYITSNKSASKNDEGFWVLC